MVTQIEDNKSEHESERGCVFIRMLSLFDVDILGLDMLIVLILFYSLPYLAGGKNKVKNKIKNKK